MMSSIWSSCMNDTEKNPGLLDDDDSEDDIPSHLSFEDVEEATENSNKDIETPTYFARKSCLFLYKSSSFKSKIPFLLVGTLRNERKYLDNDQIFLVRHCFNTYSRKSDYCFHFFHKFKIPTVDKTHLYKTLEISNSSDTIDEYMSPTVKSNARKRKFPSSPQKYTSPKRISLSDQTLPCDNEHLEYSLVLKKNHKNFKVSANRGANTESESINKLLASRDGNYRSKTLKSENITLKPSIAECDDNRSIISGSDKLSSNSKSPNKVKDSKFLLPECHSVPRMKQITHTSFRIDMDRSSSCSNSTFKPLASIQKSKSAMRASENHSVISKDESSNSTTSAKKIKPIVSSNNALCNMNDTVTSTRNNLMDEKENPSLPQIGSQCSSSSPKATNLSLNDEKCPVSTALSFKNLKKGPISLDSPLQNIIESPASPDMASNIEDYPASPDRAPNIEESPASPDPSSYKPKKCPQSMNFDLESTTEVNTFSEASMKIKRKASVDTVKKNYEQRSVGQLCEEITDLEFETYSSQVNNFLTQLMTIAFPRKCMWLETTKGLVEFIQKFSSQIVLRWLVHYGSYFISGDQDMKLENLSSCYKEPFLLTTQKKLVYLLLLVEKELPLFTIEFIKSCQFYLFQTESRLVYKKRLIGTCVAIYRCHGQVHECFLLILELLLKYPQFIEPIIIQALGVWPQLFKQKCPLVATVEYLIMCKTRPSGKRYEALIEVLKSEFDLCLRIIALEECLSYLLYNLTEENSHKMRMEAVICVAIICHYQPTDWVESILLQKLIMPMLEDYYTGSISDNICQAIVRLIGLIFFKYGSSFSISNTVPGLMKLLNAGSDSEIMIEAVLECATGVFMCNRDEALELTKQCVKCSTSNTKLYDKAFNYHKMLLLQY